MSVTERTAVPGVLEAGVVAIERGGSTTSPPRSGWTIGRRTPRNFIPKFVEPYTTGIGTVYDVGDYEEAMRRVLAAADYAGLRAAQAEQRASGARC
jgi:hypothetical protein